MLVAGCKVGLIRVVEVNRFDRYPDGILTGLECTEWKAINPQVAPVAQVIAHVTHEQVRIAFGKVFPVYVSGPSQYDSLSD